MARKRQSYRERIESFRRRHPGSSLTEARGHGATPERPERVLRQPARYPRYLASLNQRRAAQGLPPLNAGEPPMPGPGTRQIQMASLEDAEQRYGRSGIPPDMGGDSGGVSFWLAADGTVWVQITQQVRRRRRAA